MSGGRLNGLDGLRGIAALCVVLFHLPLAFHIEFALFEKAYLAVDFFFMLSGYVLARTYDERFKQGLAAPNFLLIRLRRLWPTIAVGLALGFAVSLDDFGLGRAALLLAAGLALVPTLGAQAIFPLNGVIWSIFFELFANLVHATLLWRVSRAALVIGIIVLLPAMATIAIVRDNFDVGSWSQWFAAGFPRVLLSYLLGVTLYRTFRDKSPFRVPLVPLLLAMPALFVLAWAIGLTNWVFDLAFVALACPFLILGGLCETGRVGDAAKFLGNLSFPLYAVHVPILFATADFGGGWAIGIVGAFAVAWLVASVFTPGARNRRQFGTKPAPGAA